MNCQGVLLWYRICPVNLGKCRKKSKHQGQDTVISFILVKAQVSLFFPLFLLIGDRKKWSTERGKKRSNWAMVSRMRASTEKGDRQSPEQRSAKGKFWKKNSHCFFYMVLFCNLKFTPTLCRARVLRVPRGHSSTFKHSQPGDHVLNSSLQKSAPVSQHH